MARRLWYVGKQSPWYDIHASVQFIKDRYPKIQTPQQMRQLIMRWTIETAKTQRQDFLQVFIPGRDLLAEDVTTIAAWPFMSTDLQNAIQAETPDLRRRRLDSWAAERGQPNLSRSYIWCHKNLWEQEVDEADYHIIMATPAKQAMWEPERQGFWNPPPRAYDDPELFPFTKHEVPIGDWNEADKVIAYHKLKDYTPGADVRS